MPRTKPKREQARIDYRSLAERAPVILYRYRLLPDPAMEYINPAVTEALGYSPDDFYADPDLVRTTLAEDTARSTEPDWDTSGSPILRRWRRRDGTYADIEDRRIEIRDATRAWSLSRALGVT